MEHFLQVATNGKAVGRLGFESMEGRYRFEYDEAWREQKGAFSLSPHILHSGEEPAAGAVHRFLENLLPEGRALEIASVVYQISKSNVYGLIGALGAEPVGAFSFLPIAGVPGADVPTEPVRREISNDELSQRIRERDAIPFPVWDKKVRLSVAGYQDKLQVMVEGERISLVDGALSSTHILKPESRSPNTPFMVANEHFCMSLAAAMGLPAARVEIRRIPEPILLIERFDRIPSHAADDPTRIVAVERRHVIDSCQALDVPSHYKYERNLGHGVHVRNIREGVSFEKLFSLEQHFEEPARAKTFMLRWALLQLLIGNSDAHGKNLSWFLRRTRLSPAPMYDLVSINAYGVADVVEQELAMAYGDAFLLAEVGAFQVADFAKRIGMRAALVSREMVRMAQAAKKLAPELAQAAVYIDDERDLVHRVSDFVCAQADRLLALAPEVPKVNRDLM
jgi:serine/threonine-protein kinase HipA